MRVSLQQKEAFRSTIFIPPKDKQKLVDIFAWLIHEDKKQNPVFYEQQQEPAP